MWEVTILSIIAGKFFSKMSTKPHACSFIYVLLSHVRVTNDDKFDWTKIRLWYDGSNVAYITSELVTSCTLDLTYYPFDKQTCDVKIRNEVTTSKGKTPYMLQIEIPNCFRFLNIIIVKIYNTIDGQEYFYSSCVPPKTSRRGQGYWLKPFQCPSLKQLNIYYRPQTKLREGNVLKIVRPQGGQPSHNAMVMHPPPMNGCTPEWMYPRMDAPQGWMHSPPKIRTVNRRAVRILLECILVDSIKSPVDLFVVFSM